MEIIDKNFEDIKERLIEFNGEKPHSKVKKKLIRIDYEYIYGLRLLEKEDIDPVTGLKSIRKLTERELVEVLRDYIKSSFNITIDGRYQSFMSVIEELTKEVEKLNEEEEVYQQSLSKKKPTRLVSDETALLKEFTTNDLLYALETVENLHTSKTTLKPHPGSLKRLGDATINIDSPNDFVDNSLIRRLTQEEIDDIIDPDFQLGC